MSLCENACRTILGGLLLACCAADHADGAESAAYFELDLRYDRPLHIASADGRIHVLGDRGMLYAYTASGQRVPTAEFDLELRREGIVFANGQFHVVVPRGRIDTVDAYTASGQPAPAGDFKLDEGNDRPSGIAFANGRFYVVDREDDKVYAYTASGQRDQADDFDLMRDNRAPTGITFANGRFYVVDGADDKVYAYTASGQHDPPADFELYEDNTAAQGITFANGRFYVADVDARVYMYYDTPDLTTTTSVSASSLDVGERFGIEAVVRNEGALSATPTTLRYYVSTAAEFAANGTQLAAAEIDSLAAGAAAQHSISLTAPRAAGCYFFGACADGVDGETYAGNNCSAFNPVAVGDRTDLAVTSFDLDYASSLDRILATVQVTNSGAFASLPQTLKYGISRRDDARLDHASDIPALVPGESKIFDLSMGPGMLGNTTYRACIEGNPCGDEDVRNDCGSDSISLRSSW